MRFEPSHPPNRPQRPESLLFWQPDYFDRLIRSPEHFSTVKTYIRENPAKADLKSGFIVWDRS
jgi:REP element-mobilizing transposase RayT